MSRTKNEGMIVYDQCHMFKERILHPPKTHQGKAGAAILDLYRMNKYGVVPLYFFPSPRACMENMSTIFQQRDKERPHWLRYGPRSMWDFGPDSRSVGRVDLVHDLTRVRSSASELNSMCREIRRVVVADIRILDSFKSRKGSRIQGGILDSFEIALDAQLRPAIDTAALYTVAQECFIWWAFDDCAIICELPTEVHFNSLDVLHNDSGPALAFRDGHKYWVLNGRITNEQLVMGNFTWQDINSETNQELRVLMMQKYGIPKYIQDSGMVPVDKDRYGELYSPIGFHTWPGYLVVKVRNSSPEPDGTYKDYFLRTTWRASTPHEGIAATFGMDRASYNPEIET